jgi:hypothetical protein
MDIGDSENQEKILEAVPRPLIQYQLIIKVS